MNEIKDGETLCPHCHKEPSAYRNAPHTLPQGAILNHRYRIGGVIGEGGFGITYIGIDMLLQVRVAVKEFFPNGMVNRNNTVSNEVLSISTDSAKELFSKSRENFLREARTMAKFTNESGIVAVRDFFEENRTVYIVMEYLDGITLKNYLKRVGTISWDNTVCLLMPVFYSLKKIHEKNLIHRDISPDNIMLVGEQVKLLDFGAARDFADEKSLSVMLKHGYAPMEQYRRHGTQGAWTDIYALCATMYMCVTGQIPPDAPDRVFEDDLKMPGELGVASDPIFDKVLRHGLAIRPEERIQSIDQLLSELSEAPGIDITEPAGRSVELPASAASLPPLQNDREAGRLSEYIPRMVEDDKEDTERTLEPEPLPEQPSQPEQPTQPQQNPEPVPAAQPEKKSKEGLVIAAAAVISAVLIGGIVAAVLLSGHSDTGETESSEPASSPVSEQTAEEGSAAGSKEESSKAEGSTLQSSEAVSSKPEESSDPSSATESSFDASTEEPSKSLLDGIEFLDPKGVFSFENGVLKIDLSIMGLGKKELAGRMGKGSIFISTDNPDFGREYEVLVVPFESPKNSPEWVETVDFYFKDDMLVAVANETTGGYDTTLEKAAKELYGKPVSSAEDNCFWNIKDSEWSFELRQMIYDSGESVLIQKYTSPDYGHG